MGSHRRKGEGWVKRPARRRARMNSRPGRTVLRRSVEDSMAIPATMKALLLKGEGYSREPSAGTLDSLQPWLEQAAVAVPQPQPSQVLIEVRLASTNPSDVVFIQGLYGQPRVRGRPA